MLTTTFEQRILLIGNKVRELREERKMTIKELSQKSGISIKYLQKIENGQAAGINTIHFNRLCKDLNLSSVNEILYFY